MRELADRDIVQPVHFREGDFWFDFAEDFNRLLAATNAYESLLARNGNTLAEPPRNERPHETVESLTS